MQKKPQPLSGSTGETACIFHHASDSFLQQDTAKALIHLPKSYFCRIVSNSAISIPILYYIIVRQAWKIMSVLQPVSFSRLYFTFTRDVPDLEIPVEWTLKLTLARSYNSDADLKYEYLVRKTADF